MVKETLFIINNHRSHFLSWLLPPVGPLHELLIIDIESSLQLEIQSVQKKRMEQWIILCDIIVYDGDVSCFPVLPFAEATPEYVMLLT